MSRPSPLHQSPESGDRIHSGLSLAAMSPVVNCLPTIPEETPPRTAFDCTAPSKSSSSLTASQLESQMKTSTLPRLLKPGFYNNPPFQTWLKASWVAIATQLLCLSIAELVYLFAKPLMPRYFPLFDGVWTTSWGLQHGKPYLAEYITTLVSAIISFAVPFLIMGAIGLWYVRDFWESNAAIMGLGYALATATLFQSFIKWFIGGLRPHFLAVCLPRATPSLPALGPAGHAV